MQPFFALVVFFFISHSWADSECPTGWIFNADTTKCYYFSENLMTLDEAIPFCESIGGSIVTISSYSEKSAITAMTNQTLYQPWIGARRNLTTGSFYNIDKSYFYSMWYTGEPTVNGNCATFKGIGNGGLQATPCYQLQTAFCKQTPALCNGGVFGGPSVRSGSIHSPGFPVQYYNNLNCYYYINAPNGTYITIDFATYLVQDYFDYVDVYNGNTTSYSNYLGSVGSSYSWLKDTTFESTSNQMLVVFYTNYAITEKGWNATWSAKKIMPDIRQYGYNGTMTSPNYPNNYDSYDEQLYYISVGYGAQINMTIDDFRTESKYDYLNIYNSTLQNNRTLVATLAGMPVTPWNYVSSGNYLSMKFVSDGSLEYKGWHMYWNIC